MPLEEQKNLESLEEEYNELYSPTSQESFITGYNMFFNSPLAIDIAAAPFMSINFQVVRLFGAQSMEKVKSDIMSAKIKGQQDLELNYLQLADAIKNGFDTPSKELQQHLVMVILAKQKKKLFVTKIFRFKGVYGTMIKRITFSLLLVICLFLVTGCGNKNTSEIENKANEILNTNSEVTEGNKETGSEKILVVYFSKTGENYNVGEVSVGNTAMMASYIKEYLNADSYEIVPVNKYSDNYKESTEEAKKEQNDNARPEIKNKLNNLSYYDTVFIGYPIWWGNLPQILYTFLETYDFDGIKVIPFNTHEGSGSAGTYITIKNKLTNANVNTNGLALQGKIARTEEGKERTINWLKELGY